MADRCPSLTGTTPGRFLSRRLGLPRPASGTVDGQVVRICGQSLLRA
ncbi:hypothetical protein [Streptomyces hirsutus]|nr:hypothetical protein [Streptomyces hirsutus]